MIKFDKVIIFLIVKLQQTFSKTNKKTEFPFSIKLIVMEDASRGNKRRLINTGRVGK